MRFLIFTLGIISICSCTSSDPITPPSIDQSLIAKHLAELSSDEYLGRMPCTEGETKTVKYLTSEMSAMGLDMIGGSYLQDVPLLDLTSTSSQEMDIQTPTGFKQLRRGLDFVINTERKTDAIGLKNSELVFCGFGTTAPERDWYDYDGIDMKGKTAVVLVNDPGFGGSDSTFFKGNTMTYYGRWTYKYDEADRQGADGLLIIHETTSAGYPWQVVQSSWSGSQQGLSGIDRSEDCGVKGWISLNAAVDLFKSCNLDLPTLIREARKPGFKPVPMNAKANVNVDVNYKECVSKNVFGYVKGTKYPDEFVIYTAHWDHIGVGKPVEGDSIYNGAFDNASGTSTLLAMADALSTQKPERSVGFLFVTAEEQGLLGSEYYAENPLVPLAKTVANINLDGVNPMGEMNDLTIVGIGHSEMDEIAEKAAKSQGRYVRPEAEPEKGFFFRSDQFNFAKKGVPVLYADGSYDAKEGGVEAAEKFRSAYTATRYHQPADGYDPETWNYEGMVQDGQLFLNIGLDLANSQQWPQWYPGGEFSRPKSALKD